MIEDETDETLEQYINFRPPSFLDEFKWAVRQENLMRSKYLEWLGKQDELGQR